MGDSTAKVVKIIDDTYVILNVGRDDGVAKGHRYVVYEICEELFDPDTGESLGVLEVYKGEGVIAQVQEKMSHLQSDRFETTETPLSAVLLGNLPGNRKIQKPFYKVKLKDIARRIN
ncbi:MAG: hypothetical protein HQL51_16480 [Magnetococcales bacterium]|nr:hypothetical protein [Magnetococcales bacterium]